MVVEDMPGVGRGVLVAVVVQALTDCESVVRKGTGSNTVM